MMSEPLPSGWHSAPSEARRWIWGPSSPPTSFPPAPLPVFLVPSPRPPFHLSLSSLHFISFRSPPLLLLASGRGALRCCAPQQEQTSPRGRHGATESRWMDLSEPFLRSPGIITGPPWGFTRPEVRHQRDTCSTLTIIAAQASALSFFVRSLSYRFYLSLSFPFSLSLSLSLSFSLSLSLFLFLVHFVSMTRSMLSMLRSSCFVCIRSWILIQKE